MYLGDNLVIKLKPSHHLYKELGESFSCFLTNKSDTIIMVMDKEGSFVFDMEGEDIEKIYIAKRYSDYLFKKRFHVKSADLELYDVQKGQVISYKPKNRSIRIKNPYYNSYDN